MFSYNVEFRIVESTQSKRTSAENTDFTSGNELRASRVDIRSRLNYA